MKFIGVKGIRKVGVGPIYSIQNNETDLYEDTPNFIAEGLVSKNSKHACLASKEMVLTSGGYKSISKLKKTDRIAYMDDHGRIMLTKKFKLHRTGKQKIYKITTESGKTLRVTGEHRFFRKEGDMVNDRELKNLDVGDSVLTI